ncbi:MAG: transporter [Rhodospirillales bacterium]|nr:transporter [Rhodospirillales bacterium]
MVGMMLTILIPVLPEIAKEVPVGRSMLIAMPTMGIVVGGIIAGYLLSRASARTIMLSMIAVFGIVGMAGMVLQGWPLLISRFLTGVVATCVSAASTTLVGEHIPIEKRPRVLGLQMAGSSIAGVIAMNISGLLSDGFGWRASFALFPAIAILILVPGALLIPASRRPQTGTAAADPTAKVKSGWRLVFDMWPLYLFLLAMHATVYTSNSQTPFLLADQGVASAAVRSRLQSINQIMIVLSAFAYPLTRRILGTRWIPAFFLTMAAAGLVTLGLSHNLLQVGIALALMGIGSGTLFPHQSNLVLARAAPEIRGRAVGLMVSTQFLADSINPWVYPPLASAVGGLPNALIAVGLACVIGIVVALGYGARATNIAVPEGAKSYGH